MTQSLRISVSIDPGQAAPVARVLSGIMPLAGIPHSATYEVSCNTLLGAVSISDDGASLDLIDQEISLIEFLQTLREAIDTAATSGPTRFGTPPYLEVDLHVEADGDVITVSDRHNRVSAPVWDWLAEIAAAGERVRDWLRAFVPASASDAGLGPWVRGESESPSYREM